MSANGDRASKLIRVGGPLIRLKMTMRPVEPLEGPVTDGPLIRVGGPLIRLKMTMKPVEQVPPELPPSPPAEHADAGAADLADIEPAG